MDDELGRKLQDFDLAIESAPYYGLKKDQAEKEIDMIKSVVRNNWRELAKKNGISRGEIERMEPALKSSWGNS